MSYNNHLHAGPALQVEKLPWLIFLFLAAVFFLSQHDLYFSKTGLNGFNPSEDDVIAEVVAGTLIRRIALFSLALFAGSSLARHRTKGRLRINGLLGWVLLSFVGWSLLSLIWADDIAITSRRLVAFAILCLAAAAIARRFSLREIILWTFFSSVLFLIIGVSAELVLGTFRPFASGYRFAGTLHPNGQGINCALLLLSGLAAADMEKRGHSLFRVCALIGFAFLILTGSRTASAAVLVAVVVYLAVISSRRSKIVVAYALSIVFCSLFFIRGDAFLPDLRAAVMLGREDATVNSFNGRTGVWKDARDYIARRPVLGYGYGGFWTERHIAEISGTEKWTVAHSHSAYLECLLNLGVVGLVAYVFAFFGGIWRSYHFYTIYQNAVFAFSAAFLIFWLTHGFLESGVLDSDLALFLTMVVLAKLAFPRPAASLALLQNRIRASGPQPQRSGYPGLPDHAPKFFRS